MRIADWITPLNRVIKPYWLFNDAFERAIRWITYRAFHLEASCKSRSQVWTCIVSWMHTPNSPLEAMIQSWPWKKSTQTAKCDIAYHLWMKWIVQSEAATILEHEFPIGIQTERREKRSEYAKSIAGSMWSCRRVSTCLATQFETIAISQLVIQNAFLQSREKRSRAAVGRLKRMLNGR